MALQLGAELREQFGFGVGGSGGAADAAGAGPSENEPWLAFLARKNSRSPYLAALREAGARIGALEERVAALEARDK